eukprot:8145542-Pyramimonas_sp.AAC.1
MRGDCSRGDGCRFSHDPAQAEADAAARAAQPKSDAPCYQFSQVPPHESAAPLAFPGAPCGHLRLTATETVTVSVTITVSHCHCDFVSGCLRALATATA